MTREAKIGMMMVALLVGVFGFMIYKRVHRPAEGIAAVNPASDDDLSFGEDDRRSNRIADRQPKRPARIADDFQAVENKVDSALENMTQELNAFAKRQEKRRPAAAAQELPDDFDQPRRKSEPVDDIPAVEPQENAFDEEVAKAAPKRLPHRQKQAANPFDDDVPLSPPDEDFKPHRKVRQTSSDPFADGIEAPAKAAQFEFAVEPGKGEVVEEEVEPGKMALDLVEPEQPRRTADFDTVTELAPRDRRRAAPMKLADDSWSDSVEKRSDVADGGTYTIQPNDNFWSIARKRYGAGRYYMALATHNRQIIADPKMMKPGIVINTPPVEVLERKYHDVIPKLASPESSTEVPASQPRKSNEVEPVGYFMSSDGTAYYRVGNRDTLTGIAKSHLGRSGRWVQILEMNRNVLQDGNQLKIGMVLRLPADASRIRVAGGAADDR